MASDKTRLTELGTALGLVYDPSAPFPACIGDTEVPGIDASEWRAVLLGAAARPGSQRDLLLAALANGRAFRQHVLRGRAPSLIEWSGGTRRTWVSDIPRDLTVDGVWFIQAKFDSTCVLNTSPAALVDSLLADDGVATRRSWYDEVALPELQRYYEVVCRRVRTQRDGALRTDDDLPDDVRDLDAPRRRALRAAMAASAPDPHEDERYTDLCRAVSVETALRWQHRLRASTDAQRTQLLFRMLRIAGGPYWVLGTRGRAPVRLSVTDTRTWRERYDLRSLEVRSGRAGQPQVDWRATVIDRQRSERRDIEGRCEIRWSHGKLSGNPECKVQVHTPMGEVPGYHAIER